MFFIGLQLCGQAVGYTGCERTGFHVRGAGDYKKPSRVVEAGKTIIIDKPKMLKLADKMGICVIDR
jgi:DUF1009 family protein